MKIPRPSHTPRPHGFTMVEIALCLAIIGFALVAIIGVLPLGMTVQRDNRAETVINQDGVFWMNAIRSGSPDVVDLTYFVDWIRVNDQSGSQVYSNLTDSAQIIGLLSTPNATNFARVRAITGSAAEQDKGVVGFDYVLFSQVHPFGTGANTNALLQANLYELRLVFRWPVLPNNSFGNGKKVFRSLVSGLLPDSTNGLYFFERKSLAPQP